MSNTGPSLTRNNKRGPHPVLLEAKTHDTPAKLALRAISILFQLKRQTEVSIIHFVQPHNVASNGEPPLDQNLISAASIIYGLR